MKRENYRIACRKFDCAHTGENIARKIDSIMGDYGIQAKVFYCLSDNGSNMKKGLRLISKDSEVLEEELDDDCWDVWDDRFEPEVTEEEVDEVSDSESEDFNNNNLEEEEEKDVDRQLGELEEDQEENRRSFNRAGLKKLGCYPHTFQLAILKSTKKNNNAFGKILKKTRKFVVKYRRSSKAKATLKTQFKKRILGYCKTRWWTDQVMLKRLF